MRKTLGLLLIILLSPPLVFAQPKRTTEQKPFAITHVTVIDTTGASAKRDMTVVIARGIITSVGKTQKVRIPKDARLIDATGKFLIPGLWDMHVHLGDEDFDKSSYLPLFVANGITGIRLMYGEPAHYLWRKEIERETLLGPRLIIGSFLDSPKMTPAEALEAVRKAGQEGADFVKVHDQIPRDSYFALINEAKRLHLPVEGHVPKSITAEEASAAGQRSIEHLTGVAESASNSSKAEALFAIFRKNHTWQCPTLIMRHSHTVLDDSRLADDPRLKYVKPSWRKNWLNMQIGSRAFPADEWVKRMEIVRKEIELVGELQKAGVGILAGTDDGNYSPYVFPGFGLHDELALLVKAGLTPMEALQAATLNPARFLNKLNVLGTVEEGKYADLVLLDANPLEDIHNTKRINAVIVRGRFLDRKRLDDLLVEIGLAVKRE